MLFLKNNNSFKAANLPWSLISDHVNMILASAAAAVLQCHRFLTQNAGG